MTIHPDHVRHKAASAVACNINDILKDMGLVPSHDDLVLGNSWAISVVESYEKPVGTSFTNEAAANLAADLIRRFYLANIGLEPNALGFRASILIIAPYSTMVADMKTVIAAIPKHSIDHSLVDVRTVDSSMSHEADIVIILHTCTERLGFTAAADRMAVMTTRARFAQIFITGSWDKDDLRGRGKLMEEFLDSRSEHNALLRTTRKRDDRGWNMYCTKCYRPGHLDYLCKNSGKLKCIVCREKHHVHDCQKPRPVGAMAITRDIDGFKAG
jgi:hypothetical protein